MASFPTIWLALALLWSMAAAQQVVSSNTSTAQPSGTFQLMATSQMSTIAELIALTDSAANINMPPPGLTGTLFLTNTDTVVNLTERNIAYISCDASDYPGNLQASDLLQRADGLNATASILYSTTSNFCQLDKPSTSISDSVVYSMTNFSESSTIVNDLTQPPLPPSQHFFITIVHNGTNGGNSTNNSSNSNPLGPSPSTAVAMIILYSITGIITALFLIIIVTGAIRAHRNPERYGPRDMMGRPRQSRARGLARAMLDTLPIVKFGEREAPKPTDVELASTVETRDVGAVDNAHETTTQSSSQEVSDAPSAPENGQRHEESRDENGISAAEPLPAVAAGTPSSDEGLGCSICTDDFEKGQDIRVLPCNHKFHPACVDPWLLNVSGTCPLCRIDLRPTTSDSASNRDSQDADSPELLAPPLEPETEHSHRRRSALRDMLSLRSRPNATAEERLAALRRLREERRQAEDALADSSTVVNTGVAGSNADETLDASRRKRMSARLQEVFSVRTRRGTDNVPEGEASNSSGSAGGAPRSDPSRGPESQNSSEGQRRSGDASG
ncbi:uncharacterized protein BDZ99DRAFT_459684 [Mytilinidion resinicola]|uniref:RING-type domain-containing protein n=1 Tax=Mytilinidion resinicola TaxID=574789 RepID=A0A6A6Z186_9PEZI|nr:uncharacterized protein BDZ99DRAFT_459684 [Mytilinidion resinicola]KAF2813935.1 hypothetical protein BDZ99DRAFT_459684 [Mytilinidion resinicola]